MIWSVLQVDAFWVPPYRPGVVPGYVASPGPVRATSGGVGRFAAGGGAGVTVTPARNGFVPAESAASRNT
jgi:hypothetical protein